jgi:hypothetical protein
VDALYARPEGVVAVPLAHGATSASLDALVDELGWGPRAGRHLALAFEAGRSGYPEPLVDYLAPIVGRLGQVRFDAVFARRARGSTLRIGPARPGSAPPPPHVSVRTSASATSIDWKEEVHAACRAATPRPAPPGPIGLDLRLTLSRRRDWTALWRPALEALGPILGVPDPARPYVAHTARVTEVGLHRRFSDGLGHRVLVEVWWRPAQKG